MWLDLRVGNGLELPYLGYLKLDITILCNDMPAMGIFLVKDPKDHQMQFGKLGTLGELGMNITKRFYQEMFLNGQSLRNLGNIC